jgi:hypothetical protein
MRNPKHVIRDVVHDYIGMDDLDRKLIDLPIFQRLRYVRQNDVAYLVYPSLNISRFEHSLGVFHLAGLLAESAIACCKPDHRSEYLRALGEILPVPTQDVADVFCRAARWYGLLHDIGHLPFSHLTEHYLDQYRKQLYPDYKFNKLHEAAGAHIVKSETGPLANQLVEDPNASFLVKTLMASKSLTSDKKLLQPIKDIVDSEVDADRIDSTARDGMLSGGDYGRYDISRLSRHATLYKLDAEWKVFFTTRAVSAVESLLVERCKTHRWIHFKPKVVSFKNAFRHCVSYLKIAADEWHADRYVHGQGYLDDSYVFSKICALKDDLPEHVHFAKSAIIHRANTAVPFWKRRDEFQRLSNSVAEGESELTAANRDFPVLNQLGDEVGYLEEKLNQKLSDEQISQYRIVSHRDWKVIHLTEESRMVQSLRDVIKAEPAFGVTVLGEHDEVERQRKSLEDCFITVARNLLLEIASK